MDTVVGGEGVSCIGVSCIEVGDIDVSDIKGVYTSEVSPLV